jgi:hypothetical protein
MWQKMTGSVRERERERGGGEMDIHGERQVQKRDIAICLL